MQDLAPQEPSTLKEARIEIKLLRDENEFLKKQLEVAQTFQARMGLTLNKITIEELFDRKLEEVKARDLSRTSILAYKHAKHYFSTWTKTRGLEYADEITYDHTHEFWNWFKVTPGLYGYITSECSRIGIWQVIKATFQYAEKRNSIIKNPFENRVFPISPVSDWWDDVYYNELIGAIRTYAKPSFRHRYETITRCLYTTGLRISLFLGVKHKNVKVDGNRVFITTKRKVQKSSRIQEVTTELLNKKAKVMFLEYYKPESDGYVFIKGKMLPLSQSDKYRLALRMICKKAGLPYKSPHKAKHGFVTKMLSMGYSSVQICKMTGNSTPSLIEKTYNHVQLGDFRDKVKADLEEI